MYASRDLMKSDKENNEILGVIEKGDESLPTLNENIAINFLDAPAAVEGWFNSKDHRVKPFRCRITYIGIGVYKTYFTQKYIKR